MTPIRLNRVLTAVSPPGGAALLIGESWSGKNRLAEEAAYALEHDPAVGAQVLLLPEPPPPSARADAEFETQFLAEFGVSIAPGEPQAPGPDPLIVAMHIVEAIEREKPPHTYVVVAPALDRYPLRVSTMLSTVARSDSLRLIGTARYLSAGAAQIARDPRVHQISIAPLDFDEATLMLTQLLGGTHIEFTTLHHWYALTNGYVRSLTVLVQALDRRGLIARDNGMIWDKSRLRGAVPEEFLAYLEQACTPAELNTLESIALATPVTESAILEQFSPDHLMSLHDLGVITTSSTDDGGIVLAVKHPWLVRALKSRMSSDRHRRTSEGFYLQLRQDHNPQTSWAPQRFTRLVTLGLETGRTVPIEWLYTALDDPSLEERIDHKLRISMAIIHHPDAFGAPLAEAAISVCHTARLLGDRSAITEAAQVIYETTHAPASPHALDPTLQLRLLLELVTHLTLDLHEYEIADEVLARLEADTHDPTTKKAELLRSARALYLVRTGQLRRAAEVAPCPEDEASMPIEWARTPARFASAIVLTQVGRFSEAIDCAERARTLISLSDHDDRHYLDKFVIAIFIAQWSSGLISAASETLAQARDQELTRTYDTSFIETGLAALALSEGRWQDTVQHATRAIDRFAQDDPFGLMGLTSAIEGYAHAALGDHLRAHRSFLMAEAVRPGTGQAVRGIVRILSLEARLWNNDPDIIERAKQTIAWASAEGLAYVELRALTVLVSAQGSLYPTWLARARHLAGIVEEPMSSALLTYLEEGRKGIPEVNRPSTRFLSELGIWVSLPRTPVLTAREREIALHAALGYSSRWIAEHFFLSIRTVETHLQRVFTKLDVRSRDELRSHLSDGMLAPAEQDRTGQRRRSQV